MAKLTGYNKVAVVEQSGREYHYALYDDKINVGDQVYVTGNTWSVPIFVVKEIISVKEASERFEKNITAEVICKVDTRAYENRVSKRKGVEKLKKEMDKKIREMQEIDKYVVYAEKNPELAEMLAEYKNLTE